MVGTTDEGLEKRGADEIRTDTNPLTSRFSALGTPVSVAWMSGTVGDAPGPSTYWIDAVVELDESVAAALREQAPATTDLAPGVVEPLLDRLPDGPLLRSPALDQAFRESGFWSEAYLAQDEPVLVLVSLGE